MGFQGDHYDIDIDTREVAIELGATACDSRELVRRLRGAGLRLRPSTFPKWSMVEQWTDLDGVADVLAAADLTPELRVLADRHLRGDTIDAASGVVVLTRSLGDAVMVFGDGNAPSLAEEPATGVHMRVDRFDRWAVELVHPPLRAEQ